MNRFDGITKPLMWFMALLLAALAAGCGGGGGGDPILGGGIAGIAPTVTAVTPLANATGVPINLKKVTAAFSKAMDAATLTTGSFTLACPAGTPVTGGSVAYLTAGSVATFTLPAGNLPVSTICTATITTAAKDTTGSALVNDFVWTFTTGATADVTKPRVTLTVPADLAGTAATNTAITAAFTEDMDPASIVTASFTLTGPGGVAVTGAAVPVSYSVGSRIATFTPAAALAAGTTYTATIKGTGVAAVTDLAGNALAGGLVSAPNPTVAADYVWTFTTAAAAAASPVSVLSTNPANAATVCANSSINATFTVPSGLRMDPLTVTTGTFTVMDTTTSTSVTAASVSLDTPTGLIATFTPLSSLIANHGYTATIKGGATGVKDLAIPANTMTSDKVWSFTAGANTVNCQAPEPLNAAAPFGYFSGIGLTNQGDDPNSRITGDVGTTAVATQITGLHDSVPVSYTETCPSQGAASGCGLVTGTIFSSGATATAANSAATTAYANLSPANRPGGLDVTTNSLVGAGGLPGELGGRTLAPGVYYSVTGGVATYAITAGDLTLDAQGNPNAVWVFQTAVGGTGSLLVSSPTGPLLTVPRSVLLINGAQAKNVFWYVGAAATINTGSTMVGNIISSAATTFGTSDVRGNPLPASAITTLNGRAIALNAGATMVNTQIIVPAP
jgi:hypothetical protein